jgi:hypothetical protein
MDELGLAIGKRVREALADALAHGPTNIASAVNVGADGQVNAVYADDDVIIVQRDGTTTVTHRHGDEDQTGPGAGTEDVSGP